MTKKQEAIQYAIDHEQKVRIQYADRFGDMTSRVICPTTLFQGGDRNWMVKGWCEERMAYRTFKLVGILHHRVLADRFDAEVFEEYATN